MNQHTDVSMKRRTFLGLCGSSVLATALPHNNNASAVMQGGGSLFSTNRKDGRFFDTAGFLQQFIKHNKPVLTFDPDMNPEQFDRWQSQIRAKALELMAFPDALQQPPARKLGSQRREGYEIQRWECYPEPYCVVPFLMLVPDGVSPQSPAPAVLCFPGSSRSKESLAGEPELGENATEDTDWKWLANRQAFHFVRQGFVAIAMDNPARHELGSHLRNRSEVSLLLIWAGRSFPGISVFQKSHVLRWAAQQPYIDHNRIAVCGHSLGSDPADVLGLLYPDLVAAVIHNDFCCDWRERSIAQNALPHGSHHILPGMYTWFDQPDIEAAIAPCPLLFTEGGRTLHLDRIKAAYAIRNAEENLKVYHYLKYLTPEQRPMDGKPIPEGLTTGQYHEYANVDAENHHFRVDRAIPWLCNVFGVTMGDKTW